MKAKETDSGVGKMFVVIFILALLFLASGVFIINKSRPKPITETSNGFVFTKSGNFWYTTIKNPKINQEYNVDFRYPPSQVANVTVEGDTRLFFRLLILNNLNAAYFTFYPSGNLTHVNLAAADLSKLLKVVNGVTLVAGCTANETDACKNRPIITCENQLNKSVVIYVKDAENPKISMKDNCLTIEGRGEGIAKAYTKLLFTWYSII